MNEQTLKQLINKALSSFDLALVNKTIHELSTEKLRSFEQMVRSRKLEDVPFYKLLAILDPGERQAIYPYLLLSQSQLAQDLFVLSQARAADFPRFFVEFGATDGIRLSNTYLLEKYLGWQGVLAEPARIWHKDLQRNRCCRIDFHCVSKSSGSVIDFLEATTDPDDEQASAELSSIASFADSGDQHSERRLRNARIYKVSTLSLNDLLDKHSAPHEVGYLSIDTEGSELSILEGIDFSRYKFRVITVEHNYQKENRDGIYKLLTSHGYARTHPEISQWDDWYLLESN